MIVDLVSEFREVNLSRYAVTLIECFAELTAEGIHRVVGALRMQKFQRKWSPSVAVGLALEGPRKVVEDQHLAEEEESMPVPAIKLHLELDLIIKLAPLLVIQVVPHRQARRGRSLLFVLPLVLRHYRLNPNKVIPAKYFAIVNMLILRIKKQAIIVILRF